MPRAHTVTDRAYDDAVYYGFEGDIEFQLLEMVKRSAVATHPRGNRRYEKWILDVEDEVVYSISLFEETTKSQGGTTHGDDDEEGPDLSVRKRRA